MVTARIVAIFLASLVACGGTQTPDEEEQAYQRNDTELACSSSDKGAWTQLVFTSAAWRSLAVRAEAREADAWFAIADLMEKNRSELEQSACTELMIAEVRASADRLREP